MSVSGRHWCILLSCAEVVKKPKLDKHRGMCNASFTCIDCSTTFAGPAEYKGHTQCISEAEKYQKGLYKGPKADRTVPGAAQNGGRGDAGRSQQNGRQAASTGTYQPWAPGTGSGWVKGPTRYEASGANITPLGTPVRMSPVSETPAVPEISKTDGPDKKRKSMARDETAGETTEAHGAAGDEPKKKKAKKARQPEAAEASLNVVESDPPHEEKKSKKSKKDKHAKEALIQAGEESEDVAPRSKKSKKGKKEEPEAAEVGEATMNGAESEHPTRERKKSKKGKDKTCVGDESEHEGKAEKRKRGKVAETTDRSEVVDSMDVDTPSVVREKKKDKKDKSKKKRMEAVAVD
ncbi:hypothetical protein B0H21DRAFT_779438 [Amylocystis lapponica]|nr:hypothetical protein B0H21DRAFT_779438 [Amylocystis lapponica]